MEYEVKLVKVGGSNALGDTERLGFFASVRENKSKPNILVILRSRIINNGSMEKLFSLSYHRCICLL